MASLMFVLSSIQFFRSNADDYRNTGALTRTRRPSGRTSTRTTAPLRRLRRPSPRRRSPRSLRLLRLLRHLLPPQHPSARRPRPRRRKARTRRRRSASATRARPPRSGLSARRRRRRRRKRRRRRRRRRKRSPRRTRTAVTTVIRRLFNGIPGFYREMVSDVSYYSCFRLEFGFGCSYGLIQVLHGLLQFLYHLGNEVFSPSSTM